MKTVIIAAADFTKEKFHPVYAEFPISDRMLLECMGSYTATNEVLNAACTLMGMDGNTCVTGMYYRFPDRENRPFEVFLMDLRKRYVNARNDIRAQQEAALNQRRKALFKVAVSL